MRRHCENNTAHCEGKIVYVGMHNKRKHGQEKEDNTDHVK